MSNYYIVQLEKRMRFEADVEVRADSEEEAVKIAMDMDYNCSVDDKYLLMDCDPPEVLDVEKGDVAPEKKIQVKLEDFDGKIPRSHSLID